MIVVEKPAGLLTVATDREKTDTLYVRLNKYLELRDASRATRVFVVHRLDQETSGLVLFAKDERAKGLLQEAWPTVEKTYWAIVEGRPDEGQGTISTYLAESTKSLKVFVCGKESQGARLAVTHYRVLQTRNSLSLVEIQIQTGRKHQIRVHLEELGCPVVGDQRYGSKSDACNRLALHAVKLSLPHPMSSEPLKFISPHAKALQRLFPKLAALMLH